MFTTEIKGRGYQCEPFAFDECVAIQLELGKIMGGLAGPVVEFASTLITIDAATGTVTYDPGKIKDADKQQIGKAITALPAGIIAAGGPVFLRRILKKTSIEDKSLTGDDSLQMFKLDSPHPAAGVGTWLDHVYTGGNAAEMYLAIGWILTVNWRDSAAIGDEYRDRPAERRWGARQRSADEVIEAVGPRWLGHEFWQVSNHHRIPPHELRSWTRDQVLESYYYLRLRDLRDPRQ